MTIPYGHQNINQQDIQAVIKALRSDWLTQGPTVERFEQALCRYTGAKYAVAVSSGTAALHLAISALKLPAGSGVVSSPITFSATLNSALYCGLKPFMVDMDDATYQMDCDELEKMLTQKKYAGKIRAVIVVHFMGALVDVVRVARICRKHKISVIEDAAHAIGASYQTQRKWVKVGGCRYSKMTIFSFHPIKNMTTGEGGAVLTNDAKLYETVKRLRHHGIVKSGKGPAWAYDIPELGYNYRITDLQCALGLSQLKRLNAMIKERGRLVSCYDRLFADVESVRIPPREKGQRPAYHIYVIRVAARKRNALYDFLRRAGIMTQVNYIPVHLLSLYRKQGWKKGDYPRAEKYASECLSLPLFCGLKKTQQKKIVDTIKRFFAQ